MENSLRRTASEELVYWINEREKIRILKEEEFTKPWTKDPVMQSVYFCNIHREDDRVTRWIRKTWNETEWYKGVDTKVEANMCMARLVNRIESLYDLGWPWLEFDEGTFKASGYDLKPFWGNAYVVTTHGQPMSKVDYACGVLEHAFEASFTHPLPLH